MARGLVMAGEQAATGALGQGGALGVYLAACGLDGEVEVCLVGADGQAPPDLAAHDWTCERTARVGWRNLGMGAKTLPPPVDGCAPALRLVATTARVEGSRALKALAARLCRDATCPALLLAGAAEAPDLWAGYGAALGSLLELVSWEEPVAERHTLSLVGLLVHRREAEQVANLGELRRLVEALGVAMGPSFLAGEPLPALLQAFRSDLLLRLPYAGTSARAMAERTRRKVLDCPLPLGVTATSRWLLAMGRLLALDAELVQRLLEREEKKAWPRMETARRALAGKRLAIVADTASAAAWTGLALELGLCVGPVLLLDRSQGGEAAFDKLLGSAGHKRPEGLALGAPAELGALRAALDGAAVLPQLVVRPDLELGDSRWAGLPTVEAGIPARRKHYIYPLPELGYAGAVAQAQRLLDAWMGVH
ncbi:MAG TPA: nitrogenase component 1 [Myxococcota bacterium]|nr:nitrogenase component 1 [Myxococcota bacterium]HRY94865.1 nitrogenase component 1 [Myxococcota bacterium]HSA23165.1 nitrogenase component 1 [Myxococcota bacterium]